MANILWDRVHRRYRADATGLYSNGPQQHARRVIRDTDVNMYGEGAWVDGLDASLPRCGATSGGDPTPARLDAVATSGWLSYGRRGAAEGRSDHPGRGCIAHKTTTQTPYRHNPYCIDA